MNSDPRPHEAGYDTARCRPVISVLGRWGQVDPATQLRPTNEFQVL